MREHVNKPGEKSDLRKRIRFVVILFLLGSCFTITSPRTAYADESGWAIFFGDIAQAALAAYRFARQELEWVATKSNELAKALTLKDADARKMELDKFLGILNLKGQAASTESIAHNQQMASRIAAAQGTVPITDLPKGVLVVVCSDKAREILLRILAERAEAIAALLAASVYKGELAKDLLDLAASMAALARVTNTEDPAVISPTSPVAWTEGGQAGDRIIQASLQRVSAGGSNKPYEGAAHIATSVVNILLNNGFGGSPPVFPPIGLQTDGKTYGLNKPAGSNVDAEMLFYELITRCTTGSGFVGQIPTGYSPQSLPARTVWDIDYLRANQAMLACLRAVMYNTRFSCEDQYVANGTDSGWKNACTYIPQFVYALTAVNETASSDDPQTGGGTPGQPHIFLPSPLMDKNNKQLPSYMEVLKGACDYCVFTSIKDKTKIMIHGTPGIDIAVEECAKQCDRYTGMRDRLERDMVQATLLLNTLPHNSAGTTVPTSLMGDEAVVDPNQQRSTTQSISAPGSALAPHKGQPGTKDGVVQVSASDLAKLIEEAGKNVYNKKLQGPLPSVFPRFLMEKP